MQPLLVVTHARFHQQHADFVLHLHHLPHQQVAIAQCAPPLANRRRGHVALRQKITPQAVANLAGVDAVVLFLGGGNSPQHQRMRHLQSGSMWLEVIVDPAGEHRGFHRHTPRLGQRVHPVVQAQACGGKRSLGEDSATAVLHAVADLALVNIQSDVIHRFHGGASLVFLNQRPLSSAFLHQALLLRPIHSNLPGKSSVRSACYLKTERWRCSCLASPASPTNHIVEVAATNMPRCLSRRTNARHHWKSEHRAAA